jgi:hypothetical protein
MSFFIFTYFTKHFKINGDNEEMKDDHIIVRTFIIKSWEILGFLEKS